MSGFQTHMTIGAVGGLALIAVLHRIAPTMLPSVLRGQPPLITEALICTASAVAATWPDIDEPESWLSQRVATALTLLGGVCGGAVALAFSATAQGSALGRAWPPFTLLGLGILGGLILGSIVGKLLLRLIRIGVGGHRAGTHSIFAAGILLFAATVLRQAGQETWAILPILLMWGWALHLVGDVVTTAGWRPLAPLSDFVIRLPHPIAHYGEAIIGTLSVALCAVLLLRGGL